MPCVRVAIPGGVAVVCTRGRTRKCRTCGRPASLLCDAPLGPEPQLGLFGAAPSRRRRATCDAPICSTCATATGPDRHVCPIHARNP